MKAPHELPTRCAGGEVEASKQAYQILNVGAHLVVLALSDVLVWTGVAAAIGNRPVPLRKNVELREPGTKVAIASVDEHDSLSLASLKVGKGGWLH